MEGNVLPCFKYPPEPLRDDQIRVLVLHPSDKNDTSALINCDLLVVNLGNEPAYEALSYTWGPEVPAKKIMINDGVHLIRSNLWQALNVLRSNIDKGDSRYLWIDALCINQKNVLERNHQVAQMKRIYKQARIVLAWIGIADTTSPFALRFLSKIKSWSEMSSSDCHVNRGLIAKRRLNHLLVSKRHQRTLSAISSLCYRRYWSRVWIVQEIVLARDVLLLCGSSSLPLASFQKALSAIASLNRASVYDPVKGGRTLVENQILQSPAAWRNYQRQLRLEMTANPSDQSEEILYDLLWNNQDTRCTESRDKIYGLHGLAKECCRLGTPVDYMMSVHDLCGNLVYHHLTQHETVFSKNEVLDYLEKVRNIVENPSSSTDWSPPHYWQEPADTSVLPESEEPLREELTVDVGNHFLEQG